METVDKKKYVSKGVYETHLGRVLRPLEGKLIYPTTEDWGYKSKIFHLWLGQIMYVQIE